MSKQAQENFEERYIEKALVILLLKLSTITHETFVEGINFLRCPIQMSDPIENLAQC